MEAPGIIKVIFLGGGTLFIVLAAVIRGMTFEGADIVALTFGLIGFFWVVPLGLVIYFQKRAARRQGVADYQAMLRREGRDD